MRGRSTASCADSWMRTLSCLTRICKAWQRLRSSLQRRRRWRDALLWSYGPAPLSTTSRSATHQITRAALNVRIALLPRRLHRHSSPLPPRQQRWTQFPPKSFCSSSCTASRAEPTRTLSYTCSHERQLISRFQLRLLPRTPCRHPLRLSADDAGGINRLPALRYTRRAYRGC